MDPGRKRIEERQWSWLAVGDVVLDTNGLEYTVTACVDRSTVILRRTRHMGGEVTVIRDPGSLVRVRVTHGADAELWARVRAAGGPQRSSRNLPGPRLDGTGTTGV